MRVCVGALQHWAGPRRRRRRLPLLSSPASPSALLPPPVTLRASSTSISNPSKSISSSEPCFAAEGGGLSDCHGTAWTDVSLATRAAKMATWEVEIDDALNFVAKLTAFIDNSGEGDSFYPLAKLEVANH